jgi:hypothetical protein
MSLDPEKSKGAALAVEGLVRRGVPRDRAVTLVHRAIARMWADQPGSGLGAEVDTVLATMKTAGESAPVAAVRSAITPWLWAFSVISFGMSVVNARRIGMMFKKWKDKRRPI